MVFQKDMNSGTGEPGLGFRLKARLFGTCATVLAVCLFGTSNSQAVCQLMAYNQSFQANTAQQYDETMTELTRGSQTVRIQFETENPWMSEHNSSFNFNMLGESDWEYDWRPFVQHFRKVITYKSHNPPEEAGIEIYSGEQGRIARFVNEYFSTENWLKSAKVLNESKEVLQSNSQFVSSMIGLSNLELPISPEAEVENPFTSLSAEGRIKIPSAYGKSSSNTYASASQLAYPVDSQAPVPELKEEDTVQLTRVGDSSKSEDARLITVFPTTIGTIISLLGSNSSPMLSPIDGQLADSSDYSSLEYEKYLFSSLIFTDTESEISPEDNLNGTFNQSVAQSQTFAGQSPFAGSYEEIEGAWTVDSEKLPILTGMYHPALVNGLNSVANLHWNTDRLFGSTEASGPVDGISRVNFNPLNQASNDNHERYSENMNRISRENAHEQLHRFHSFLSSDMQSRNRSRLLDNFYINNGDLPFLPQYLNNAKDTVQIPNGFMIETNSEFRHIYRNQPKNEFPFNEYNRETDDTITIEH